MALSGRSGRSEKVAHRPEVGQVVDQSIQGQLMVVVAGVKDIAAKRLPPDYGSFERSPTVGYHHRSTVLTD